MHTTCTYIILYCLCTDECYNDDVCPFQLVPEFSIKNEHEADNTLFKYGYTRKTWEKDALACISMEKKKT